jgi:lipopolysaccharide export system protein LptA
MMRWIIVFLVSFLLFPAGACLAAEQPPSGSPVGNQPIYITSDRLEANDAVNLVRFEGEVVAKQGDVVIYADSMTVFYRPEDREVERVEALNNVRIVQGAKVATGQKGLYYRAEGRIVLTGSPRVHQGEDFIEGDEITVFLGEERSIVSSEGGSRVNAVFHPKERQ